MSWRQCVPVVVGVPVVVLQLLDGGDLGQIVCPRGGMEYWVALEEDQVVSITSQAVRALANLHRKGVVHRDIKPDQFLMAKPQVLPSPCPSPWLDVPPVAVVQGNAVEQRYSVSVLSNGVE